MSKYFIDISDNRNKIVKSLLSKHHIVEPFTWEKVQTIGENDNCIFSPAKKFTLEELNALPNKIGLICGNLSEDQLNIISKKDIIYQNLMKDELFTIKNANLTAEGVLAILLEKSKRSIFKNNVLILGGGRVARAIAILFKKIGISFSIVSFNQIKFPSYYLYTDSCFYCYDFVEKLSDFDVIINSIPAKIIDDNLITKISDNTLFIETASCDCLNRDLAINFNYLPSPALPMKYSAETAGKIMFESIIGGK